MTTNIDLTDAGLEKFNQWFANVAKPGVRIDVVMLDMLGIMEERVNSKETLVFELRGQYTNTGNPELFRLDAADVVVTEEDDEL